MATEGVVIHEKPPAKERLDASGRFDGLKPRLLMGGNALNPDHPLPPVSREQLGNFATRNYDVFTNASTNERKRHWQGKEDNNFERQKQAWIAQTTATFNGAKDFFERGEQGKQWAALYTKLGIQATSFSEQNAEALYTKYFGTTQKESVKQFVADVVSTYQQGDTFDYAEIQRDLKGIQWIANIFGETSGEVVAQLVDAEVTLLTNPDALITNTNRTEEVNNQPVTRINRLESDERRLLEFLWGNRTAEVTPTPQPATPHQQSPEPQPTLPPARRRLPEGYRWEYERKTDQDFPQKELTSHMSDPQLIADALKHGYSQQYGNRDVNELAAEISQEHAQLEATLAQHGLTSERLGEIATKIVDHYTGFIKQTYNISLPDSKNISLFPMSGKTADLYNPGRQAYGLVDRRRPVIFLDMDVITQHARRLTNKDWRELPKEQLGNLIERLLNEINPHEYTHLIGNAAFWKLMKGENTLDVKAGKLGTMVAKPHVIRNDDNPDIQYIERGRGLMEAITVELTNQWAKNMNAHLDINAYAPERQVLHALVNLLAKEQNIPEAEAFKKFAAAYFTPKGFRDLAKDLAGRHKDQMSNIVYKRPHFQSIIYALMERDAEGAEHMQTVPNYNLTLAYINNTLSQTQKDTLLQLVQHGPAQNSRVHLPLAARRSLAAQLGFSLAN